MARQLRLASAVAFVVAVTMGFAVPALGTDHGLVHLAGWGSEDEVSSYVESIAATADGSIVVADRKRDRVVRFTYGHALAGSFAATDPRGIAAIPGGGYLVAEAGRVRRTDADGTTLATYDADDPYGVALAGDVVLIADATTAASCATGSTAPRCRRGRRGWSRRAASRSGRTAPSTWPTPAAGGSRPSAPTARTPAAGGSPIRTASRSAPTASSTSRPTTSGA